MKAAELREKTREELVAELDKLKEELFNLRFQHATQHLESPKRINAVKKDIARVMTLIREIDLAEDDE